MAVLQMKPFGGIFDATVPGRGGHASWQWNDSDLNRAAAKLLAHVDRTLELFSDKDAVWLGSIENDLLQGRFPEVLASFLSDPVRDDGVHFHVPETLKDSSEWSGVGLLVCELHPGRLKHLLAVDGGICWGSALRVGAVQVPAASAESALRGSLFDPGHASTVETFAHCAWAASADLNSLAMWAAVQDETWLGRVKALGGIRGG
jgi:hypothetical protein